MKKIGKFLIMILSVWASWAGAAVTASVDRVRIAESDSFQLTIRGTAGEPVSETDLDPLRRDFDVVSTSTASKLSIVNGRTERSVGPPQRWLSAGGSRGRGCRCAGGMGVH